MSLNKLSAATVTRIKAQQVITSLVAAMKELVEILHQRRNSLDAGATQIQVKLEGDGFTHIQVKDNGTGISADSTAECAIGYCTSKIVDFSSLSTLTTYGFRGEALHSLCSEGDVEITTKTVDDANERTTWYTPYGEISTDIGNKVAPSTIFGTGKTGTCITVRNIFSRTPVRLERAKKDKAKESKQMLNLIYAYMIAHPKVSFNFSIKGSSVAKTKTGNHNTALEVVHALYGPFLANGLVLLESENEDKSIRITGLLPKSDAAKRYPFAVLNIELSPDTYDVNVTPDKKKIFFHNEQNLVKFVHNVLQTLYPISDLETILAIPVVPVNDADNKDEENGHADNPDSAPTIANNTDISSTTSSAGLKNMLGLSDKPNSSSPKQKPKYNEIRKPAVARVHDDFSDGDDNKPMAVTKTSASDDEDDFASSSNSRSNRSSNYVSSNATTQATQPPKTKSSSSQKTQGEKRAQPSSPPQQAPQAAKKRKAKQHPYDITANMDIVALHECPPFVDGSETMSSQITMKFSYNKDPVSTTQNNMQFWDPEDSLARFTPRVCGQISSKAQVLFCVEYARRLFIYNALKLLCFDNMMKTMVVPRTPMVPPLVVTKDAFGGENKMWFTATSKTPSIIRAFHLNGFELYCIYDKQAAEEKIELRAVPKDIPGAGVEDLIELVGLISALCSDDSTIVSIPHGVPVPRPQTTATHIMSEATKQANEDFYDTAQAQIIFDKLVELHHKEHRRDSDTPKLVGCCECPHGKPIFQFIASIPNIE